VGSQLTFHQFSRGENEYGMYEVKRTEKTTITHTTTYEPPVAASAPPPPPPPPPPPVKAAPRSRPPPKEPTAAHPRISEAPRAHRSQVTNSVERTSILSSSWWHCQCCRYPYRTSRPKHAGTSRRRTRESSPVCWTPASDACFCGKRSSV
jgi:hypothetical protein